MRTSLVLCLAIAATGCREVTTGVIDVLACVEDADCAHPTACELANDARCFQNICRYQPACDTPPASHCTNGDTTFISYAADGTCNQESGECDYAALEVSCPNCQTDCLDACAVVECNEDNGGCLYGGTCVPGTPPTCDYQKSVDGWACTMEDAESGVCADGTCVECRAAIDCDDPAAVCLDNVCQLLCPPGNDCDDNNPCTYDDACDESGDCGGTPISCQSDAGPCGAIRTCDGTDTCDVRYPGTDVSCDDNQACTYDDHCDGGGGCGGTSVTAYNGCTTHGPAPCGPIRSCNNTTACAESYPGATVPCSDGNICTENDHCDDAGTCAGTACGGGDVCFPSSGCSPPPTFALTTGACADLGTAHTTLTEYVVTGPPGAHVIKYNRHGSCGAGAPWQVASETSTTPPPTGEQIAGNGEFVFSIGNQVWTNCEDGLYGGWDAYATVDGVATNQISSVYHNTRCYDSPAERSFRSCAAAASYCSPCNDGDGCSNGEYCDVYSGGTPTCQAPAFWISPTCADLGTAHWGTNLLQEYRIYGPEGARVHKFNRHLSCGGTWTEASETSGSVVRIDSSGMFSLQLGSHDPYPCGSDGIIGTWEQYATVGDNSEEFQHVQTGVTETTYYNSQCAGFDTCNTAGAYCGN